MRSWRSAFICLSLLVAGVVSAAPGATEVELTGESAVAQTATQRELELVLPQRFFRVRGETGLSEPYIAELHYTTDAGQTWRSAGLFKDLDKPFDFLAPGEGRYGFFLTLVDQRGREDMVPVQGDEPHVTVLVDWTAPDVKLISPTGGEIVGAAQALSIRWKAEDRFFPEEPITIEYSPAGTTEWQTIAGPIENTGEYEWMPEGLNGSFNIRVTAADEAGHRTSVVSAAPVLVDTTPPQARLLGPELAAADEVEMEFAADDGDGSGVAQLRLWVSHDRGASWAPAGSSHAGVPLKFTATTGTYGLYVTAVDRAGNHKGAPPAGTEPQLYLSIDTERPQVRLETLRSGGAVRGGIQMPIQWEAVAPTPAARPVAIFLSPDDGNTWDLVASDLENTGTHLWDVPRINSPRCRLKITVRDATGAVGEALSRVPFTIDSTRPTSAIGIAPTQAAGRLGDLSQVLAPPARQDVPTVPQVTLDEPAADVTDGVPEALDDVAYRMAPTPAPDEPWTGVREEPFARPPGPRASFEDLLEAGMRAYHAGRLDMAKEYLQAAAEMDTGHPAPHAALGRVHAKMPGFNHTARRQAFEAAMYEFERALELGGEDADVLNDLGWILLQTGRYRDAEKVLRRAVEIGQRALYSCNLGIALRSLGRFVDAVDAFEGALSIDPAMKEAHFFLGSIYSDAGHWEEARVHWRAAADGYGADHRLGRVALAGLQQAREALGEVAPAPDGLTLRERMDRIR